LVGVFRVRCFGGNNIACGDAMSRGLFRVEVRIQYANGAVGEAHIVQEHLVTIREVRQCLDRCARLAETLREEPAAAEEQRQSFKVVG
jgi:hypothetical protein